MDKIATLLAKIISKKLDHIKRHHQDPATEINKKRANI